MALRETIHAVRGRLGVKTKKDEKILTYPKTVKKKKKKKKSRLIPGMSYNEYLKKLKEKESNLGIKDKKIETNTKKSKKKKEPAKKQKPVKVRTVSRANLSPNRVNIKEKSEKLVQANIGPEQSIGNFTRKNINGVIIFQVSIIENGKKVGEIHTDPVNGKILKRTGKCEKRID